MEEFFFACPYCWQEISVLLDLLNGEHDYVEDCEVCCNPIDLSYRVADEIIVTFEAKQLE